MSTPTDSDCVLGHNKPTPRDIGYLCDYHRSRLDGDSREIGYLIVDTRRILDGGAPAEETPRTRHTKAVSAPAPGDLAIMALFDNRTIAVTIAPSDRSPDGDPSEPLPAVLSVVASWLQCFAEERPLTNLPTAVIAQLDLMRRHHDWAARQSWVDDYARELAELRRALRIVVHDNPVNVYGKCDMPTTAKTKCGGTLLQENGSGVIRCATCKTRWVTPQEQARLSVRQ